MAEKNRHGRRCKRNSYIVKCQYHDYVLESDSDSERDNIKHDNIKHDCGKGGLTKYDQLKCCLRVEFRKLWSEHAIYTKFFVNSVLANIPDADLLAARLLENQDDIGNFVKKFVSVSNGNTLTKLLQQHILAAAAAVKAVKSGNQQVIDDAVRKVFQNSREVSSFISSLNPNKLPFKVVLKHFDEHNQFVIDMTVARNSGNFEKDIKLFDAYYSQILDFSDLLLKGLVTRC